jgi:hypothetical protein
MSVSLLITLSWGRAGDAVQSEASVTSKHKPNPNEAAFQHLYSKDVRAKIEATIPTKDKATRRELLEDALTIAYGTRYAVLADESMQPGVLTRLTKQLSGLRGNLEQACKAITSADTILLRALQSAANRQPSSLSEARETNPEGKPNEGSVDAVSKSARTPFDEWRDVDLTRKTDAMDLRAGGGPRVLQLGENTLVAPNWNNAIISLQALGRWVDAALAEVEANRADQRDWLNENPEMRWRRGAVRDAVDSLLHSWTENLGEAPKLQTRQRPVNETLSQSKTSGPFLDFVEATLRPILPPHYDGRTLEHSVRDVVYRSSRND